MEPEPSLTAQLLESRRLILEPLRVEHAEELAPVLDDPALHRFIGGAPATVNELRSRFETQTLGRSPSGRASWLTWVMRERASNRVLGTVQATITPARVGTVQATITPAGAPGPAAPRATAELAWVVGTEAQGNGFAAEAAAAIASWLRDHGVTRLRAHIHPDHHASIGVARAIGLEPTGTIVDGEQRWESSAVRPP